MQNLNELQCDCKMVLAWPKCLKTIGHCCNCCNDGDDRAGLSVCPSVLPIYVPAEDARYLRFKPFDGDSRNEGGCWFRGFLHGVCAPFACLNGLTNR